MQNSSSYLVALLLTFSALALAGCGDEPVVSYQAPKETATAAPPPAAAPAQAAPVPAPAGMAGMAGMPVQTENGAALVWQAPAGWRVQTGHPMRKASFGVGAAEVAITAFPGDVGGVLANVNRWRGQAGLAPVDEAALSQTTTVIENQGLRFVVMEAQGGATPIVAALLPWNGGTWFFKLTGPVDAVSAAKPAFLSFLKTVHAP